MEPMTYKPTSTEQSPLNKPPKISLKQRICEKLTSQSFRQKPWRAYVAYWILGLCNNYGYVVMLSAANDILHQQEEKGSKELSLRNGTDIDNPDRQCNYISTGAILLADILPSLIIKMFSPFLPFFIQWIYSLVVIIIFIISGFGLVLCAGIYRLRIDNKFGQSILLFNNLCIKQTSATSLLYFSGRTLCSSRTSRYLSYWRVRVAICILLASGGYLVVAFSSSQWMSIFGVVLTSLCSGLGEVTFLQYSSFYDKDVVSTWSSGTGGAGIAGALSYAALNSLGLRNALLIMLIVPLTMAISFWAILPKPKKTTTIITEQKSNKGDNPNLTFKKKLSLLPGLLKYMIPLGLVYHFEYFINQGMFELINYEGIFLDKAEQYRWLQVDYQIGVFISRSSVNILHVRRIWLMAVFQLINVVFFTTEAIFYYIPSFYVILALTLWEGLLGGAAYVNTFYKITAEVEEEYKQFSLGTTSFADSIGITFAGVFAILAHNGICELPKPERLSF